MFVLTNLPVAYRGVVTCNTEDKAMQRALEAFDSAHIGFALARQLSVVNSMLSFIMQRIKKLHCWLFSLLETLYLHVY